MKTFDFYQDRKVTCWERSVLSFLSKQKVIKKR